MNELTESYDSVVNAFPVREDHICLVKTLGGKFNMVERKFKLIVCFFIGKSNTWQQAQIMERDNLDLARKLVCNFEPQIGASNRHLS